MLRQLIVRRFERLHQCLVEVVILHVELLSLHGRCLKVSPLLTNGACHVVDLAIMCCLCCVHCRQLLSRHLLTLILLLRRNNLLSLSATTVEVDDVCCT